MNKICVNNKQKKQKQNKYRATFRERPFNLKGGGGGGGGGGVMVFF